MVLHTGQWTLPLLASFSVMQRSLVSNSILNSLIISSVSHNLFFGSNFLLRSRLIYFGNLFFNIGTNMHPYVSTWMPIALKLLILVFILSYNSLDFVVSSSLYTTGNLVSFPKWLLTILWQLNLLLLWMLLRLKRISNRWTSPPLLYPIFDELLSRMNLWNICSLLGLH